MAEDISKFSSTVNIVEKDVYSSKISLDSKNDTGKNPAEFDNYDPFEHRKIKHPTSDIRSAANLIKSSLGTGILAMPAAFNNSGYVVGIIGTIVIGYICTHTVAVFVRLSRECCKLVKSPQLGYAETCGAVFATGPKKLRPMSAHVQTLTDWAMAFTYLGACSVYMVLLAESLKDIITGYFTDISLAPQLYFIAFLVPLMFLVQIKNLKYLAPFSAVANVLMLVVFAICLYYIGTGFGEFNAEKVHMTNSITRFPVFLTTVIFAMEGIGVVMPTENAMKKPQHFLGCPGVLNVSMVFIVLMYGTLGLLGYLRYGDKIKGSITLNLPETDLLAVIGKAGIIAAIFFTYLLQFFVPMDIMWKNIKNKVDPKRQTIWQIFIRLMGLFCTVIIGMLLPNLEQIIGLVGAIFYSSLGLIIPAIMDIVFEWDRNLGKWNWKLWKNIIIITIGMIALIFGSLQAIKDMIYGTDTPEIEKISLNHSDNSTETW